MATESFSRTFTVNPDWGIKNLEKAIDNGSPTVKRLSTPEAKARFKEATTMTPEKALSSFSVKRNPDVENFIRTNAVAYEKSDNARTYLVMTENIDILGYFSLALSVVDIPSEISKAMMKKMRGFGRYSADSVPCYLLGQLARDDNASHDGSDDA